MTVSTLRTPIAAARRSGLKSPLLAAMAITIAIIWVYLVARAVHVSLTVDEAISWGITHGQTAQADSANNQWLNTWAMRLSQAIFGQAEWALRLPNLLAFGLYGWAVLRLSRGLRGPTARLIAFAVLVTDPFMLEFFALARGYGLSLAFAAAAIVILVAPRPPAPPASSPSPPAVVPLLAIAICGLAAFYANFAALNLVLAIFAVAGLDVAIRLYRRGLTPAARDAAAVGGVAAATLAAMVPGVLQVIHLQHTHQLYYGGPNGFVPDTIGTLVRGWGYAYGYRAPLATGTLVIAWLVVAATALLAGYAIVSGVRRATAGPLQRAAAVVGLSVLAALAEHVLLGSLYATDRVALTYVASTGVLWAAAATELPTRRTWPRRAALAGSAVIAAAALVSLAGHANLTRAVTWTSDASDRDIMQRLRTRQPGVITSARPLTMQVSFPRQYALGYYQARLGLRALSIIGNDTAAAGADLYVISPQDRAQIAPGTTLLAVSPIDGTELRARPAAPAH